LPEALARSHNDSILSRSVRSSSRKGHTGFARIVLRQLMTRPARTVAGAVLAAVLTGIVVNALVMQKERRTAPFFVPVSVPSPVSQPPVAPEATEPPVAAQPPTRPVNLGSEAAVAPASPPRSGDPIRELLRGDASKDSTHLTMSAQNALIKLGFPIKADGVAGASTVQAIQQFERAHGMPPSGEITVKLIKQLGAAAAANH
jgi:Putative peptidoglycan binding domain